MLQKIQVHPKVLEEQASFKECQSAKSGPSIQIGAVCPCEKEVKATHSFNICPKAPHGSQILQCFNVRRRIGKHQSIYLLEEQTSLEEGQRAKPGPQTAKSEPFAPMKRR